MYFGAYGRIEIIIFLGKVLSISITLFLEPSPHKTALPLGIPN